MSAAILSFRDLLAWQKAHALVLGVYQVTRCFPKEELFALSLQMRRAVVSVAANIAEGSARQTTPDLVRFLTIADGSLAEVRYFLLLALDLGYCQRCRYEELEALADEVGRLLGGLKRALSTRERSMANAAPPKPHH